MDCNRDNIKTGLRVFGVRGSQIGDAVSALCVYAYVRHHYPDAYTIWQLARKHVHATPLFYNHDLINQLTISDGDEGYGPRDIALAKTCQVRFPLMPEHPECAGGWPNRFSFYQETFRMAGLSMEQWKTVPENFLCPRLVQWFPVERFPKTIAYWPCAAYGATQIRRSRHATRAWAESLVVRLLREGYNVIQFGHPNDHAETGGTLEGCYADVREEPFMEQIKRSLGCDVIIGTDSGAGIALGAYESNPNQISLLTDHYPGHITNLTAFEPWNPNNRSFVGVGSADNISVDDVVKMVNNMIKG